MKSINKEFARMVSDSIVTLVDIGASGGVHPRWEGFGDLIRVIGFEPDAQEYAKLQQSDKRVWHNLALSIRKETRVLHVTRAQTNTSFLKPNHTLLNSLQWAPEDPVRDHEIMADMELECEALDVVMSEGKVCPDFLKVDTQGSELDILTGAQKTLVDHILMVEIEVEFAPIYEKQPLFADVDSFMRARGFILHDLGNFLSMKPRGLAGIGGAKGRLISADALYIKDFTSGCHKLYEQGISKVHAALAGYLAYGYPELGIALIRDLHDMGCDIGKSGEILRLLKSVKPSGHPLIHSLPGIRIFAKLCGQLWFKYRKPEHCLWDNPLGN